MGTAATISLILIVIFMTALIRAIKTEIIPGYQSKYKTMEQLTTDFGSIKVTKPIGVKRQRKRKQAWGTVDGMLKTITSHHRLAFTLYESHFGYAVNCIARQDQEAIMLNYWRKFVRVSGLVIRDAQSGQPIEIQQISDVRELPGSDPDSYLKAAGILDLHGEAPEDLIRRLRDASA